MASRRPSFLDQGLLFCSRSYSSLEAAFWRHAKLLAWILIVLALIITLATRLFPLFHYTHFFADQARDGFYLLDAKKGQLLTLGPAASFSAFSLPPQYFYLLMPFAWFSNDPTYQLLPNVISSLLVVPIFGWLLWRYVLADKSDSSRLLITAIGMLWISVHYRFYGLANGSWNPNPLPLVLLLIAWVTLELFRQPAPQISKGIKLPFLWLALGLLVGVGMGLHGTALFVFPVFLSIVSVYWLYGKNKWTYPALGWAAVAITFLPYMAGEYRSDFANTKAIIRYSLSSSDGMGILDRLDVIASEIQKITAYGLFVDGSHLALAALLAVAMGLYIPLLFKSQKYLAGTLLLLCLGLFLVSSSYKGQIYPHYLHLGFWLPFFLCIVAISDTRSGWWRLNRGVIGIFIAVSILLSGAVGFKYFNDELTSPQSSTIRERSEWLQLIPAGARICSYYGQDVSDLFYLDLAMLGDKHRYVSECHSGDYVLYIYDPVHRPAGKDFDDTLETISQTDKYTIQRL